MNLFFLLFTFIIIKIYFIPLSTQSREISLKNFERTFLEISKTLSIEQLQYVSNFPTSLDCNYTSSYDLSRQVDKQHVNTSMPSSSGFIHTSRRSRSSLYFSSELLPYLEENDLIRYKDILPELFHSVCFTVNTVDNGMGRLRNWNPHYVINSMTFLSNLGYSYVSPAKPLNVDFMLSPEANSLLTKVHLFQLAFPEVVRTIKINIAASFMHSNWTRSNAQDVVYVIKSLGEDLEKRSGSCDPRFLHLLTDRYYSEASARKLSEAVTQIKNVKLFVHSFNHEVNNEYLKEVTCQFRGQWQLVPMTEFDPFSEVKRATSYVSMNSEVNRESALWTLIYSNSSQVSSVEICVAVSSTDADVILTEKLLGVLCANLDFTSLSPADKQFALVKSSSGKRDSLNSTKYQCSNQTSSNSVTEEQDLDQMRPIESKCLSTDQITADQIHSDIESILRMTSSQAEHHMNIIQMNDNCPFSRSECLTCDLGALKRQRYREYSLTPGQISFQYSTVDFSFEDPHLPSWHLMAFDNLNIEKTLQNSLCLSRALEIGWKEKLLTNKDATWFFYINANTRFLRTYPAILKSLPSPQNSIISPRNAAVEQLMSEVTSPAKRVVIVNSFSEQEGLSLVHGLLLSFLHTFTSRDQVQLLHTFSRAPIPPLLKMSATSRSLLDVEISSFLVDSTRSVSWFSTSTLMEFAFDILRDPDEGESCDEEPKVILLVIDKPADFVLLNAVKNLNSQLANQIRVFVYYVAPETIDPIGKQLACENLGSWFDISSQSDLRYAHHYYSMLQPPNFSGRVTWSTIDAIRFDDRPKMTSCIPITSFTFTGGSSLEGIICMSMDRQNFFNFPDSYKTYQEVLASDRRRSCQRHKLYSAQDLKKLRNGSSVCPSRFIRSATSLLQESEKSIKQVAREAETSLMKTITITHQPPEFSLETNPPTNTNVSLFDSIAGCKRVTGENDNSHPGGLEEVCSRKFVQGAKKQKQYQRKVSFEEGTLIFSNDVMQKLSMRPTLDDLQPNPDLYKVTCFSKYLDRLWAQTYSENPFQTWQYFVSSDDVTSRVARLYPGFEADVTDCNKHKQPQPHISKILLEPDRATAKNVLVVFFLRNAKSVEYAQTLASELFNLLGVKDHVNVVVPSGRPVYSSMRPLLNNVEYLKQTIRKPPLSLSMNMTSFVEVAEWQFASLFSHSNRSTCRNVLYILTDAFLPFSDSNYVFRISKLYNVKVNTFLLGSKTDTFNYEQLSCLTGGTLVDLSGQVNLDDLSTPDYDSLIMKSHFKNLDSLISVHDKHEVVWTTSPHFDSLSGQELVNGCLKVEDMSRSPSGGGTVSDSLGGSGGGYSRSLGLLCVSIESDKLLQFPDGALVLHSIKNDPVSCDSRKNSFQYSLDRTLAKCSEKFESSTRSNLEFVSQQLRRSAQLLLDEAMNQSKNDQKDPFCSQHGTISTTCIRKNGIITLPISGFRQMINPWANEDFSNYPSLCWQSRISEEWSFFLEESLKAAPSLKFRSQFLISHTATSESPIFSIHESSGDVSQSPLARDCPETGSTGLGPNVDQSSLFARPPDFFYSKMFRTSLRSVRRMKVLLAASGSNWLVRRALSLWLQTLSPFRDVIFAQHINGASAPLRYATEIHVNSIMELAADSASSRRSIGADDVINFVEKHSSSIKQYPGESHSQMNSLPAGDQDFDFVILFTDASMSFDKTNNLLASFKHESTNLVFSFNEQSSSSSSSNPVSIKPSCTHTTSFFVSLGNQAPHAEKLVKTITDLHFRNPSISQERSFNGNTPTISWVRHTGQSSADAFADSGSKISTWPSLIGCLPVILPDGVLAVSTCIEISEESFRDSEETIKMVTSDLGEETRSREEIGRMVRSRLDFVGTDGQCRDASVASEMQRRKEKLGQKIDNSANQHLLLFGHTEPLPLVLIIVSILTLLLVASCITLSIIAYCRISSHNTNKFPKPSVDPNGVIYNGSGTFYAPVNTIMDPLREFPPRVASQSSNSPGTSYSMYAELPDHNHLSSFV